MNKFLITTDSGCDIPHYECEKLNIHAIRFTYSCDNVEFSDPMDPKEYKKFYSTMRGGKTYKTSQANPNQYYEFFSQFESEKLPILHISVGSGVSASINSARVSINLIHEDYPEMNIQIVDSKIGSLGQSILLYKACELRDSGADINQALKEIMEMVPQVNIYYTTDTLTYFAKGGRLSKVEAMVGNVLKINPILDCSPAGKLRIVEKCRGYYKAFNNIIERVKNTVINPREQTLYVAHADNEVRATELAERIVSEVGFKDYKMTFMGTILGSHSGPGLSVVFYMGEERSEKVTSLETVKKFNEQKFASSMSNKK